MTGSILWTILLTFGCGTPTNPNGNGSSAINSGNNANAETATLPTLVDPCSGTDPAVIANKVNQYIQRQIDNNMPDVKTQMTLGMFNFRAVVTITPSDPNGTPPTTTDTVYLYLGGRLGDVRAGANPKNNFQPLLAFIKNSHKRGCVNKVVFVPVASIPTANLAPQPPIDGFEWLGCDDPYKPCPGGWCAMQCLAAGSGDPANVTNSNTNSNMKSNSNTSSENKASAP